MSDSDHESCCAEGFEESQPKILGKLRYHVFVCTDAGDFCGCEQAGSPALLGALRQELVRRRLMAQVKITLMQCRQPDAPGPVLVVHPEGNWYGGVKPADIPELVEQQLVRGEPVDRLRLQLPLKPVTEVPEHVRS
ncbi:MAG: (2Fe-2S) ferredoxin domain-containing protein [Chromatiales bacterium]|nr:(2Fe-2S) ferredoxin domain-containing protein [Chromatiales bacterium]